MPGPEPKDRKHGRGVSATGDWTEVPDVPFDGAPPMPNPPGRKSKWHSMVAQWWTITSRMPHAKLWRDEDWQKVYELMYEKERYYTAKTPKEQTTAQLTEIRRREDALGIGEQARRALRIRYTTARQENPEVPAADTAPPGTPGGKVLSLQDRRASITKTA